MWRRVVGLRHEGVWYIFIREGFSGWDGGEGRVPWELRSHGSVIMGRFVAGGSVANGSWRKFERTRLVRILIVEVVEIVQGVIQEAERDPSSVRASLSGLMY